MICPICNEFKGASWKARGVCLECHPIESIPDSPHHPDCDFYGEEVIPERKTYELEVPKLLPCQEG